MRKSGYKQSGYTLIELMLAMTLLSLVLGSVVTATRAGQGAFERSVSNNALDSKSARAANRVVKELMGAGRNTIFPKPAAPFSSEVIDFQESGGWDDGAVTWLDETRLVLEYAAGEIDNGADDNGNDLVDDCRIILVEGVGTADEVRRVVANGVSEFLEGELPNGIDDNGNGLIDERGMCFEVRNNELLLRLSMEQLGPDGVLFQRTLETSIALRN